MMTLKSTISSIFNDYGIKIVSNTDKSKSAYVLNKKQVSVFEAAGIKPSAKRPVDSFGIYVLGDEGTKVVRATYYHAVREGSGRSGEPRLGTEIITDWLDIGDKLFLATDGSNVFAMKLNDNSFMGSPSETTESIIIAELPDDFVRTRANAASKKARKTKTTTEVYIRDPYVIEAAKRRADGVCEMPGCEYKAFITEKGEPYLEVHHIKPLADDGEDSLSNVAAVCPTCHREQHYSKDKLNKRNILEKAVLIRIKNP